jgi:hypothetical protein
MTEWMRMIAESAKDLPEDVYERIAARSLGQTTNNLSNTGFDFVYGDFEYSKDIDNNK